MATIRTGTGSDTRTGDMYRWARTDRWQVVFFPFQGGVECHRKIDGPGWCIDVHNEIPPGAYRALAESIGAPTDV